MECVYSVVAAGEVVGGIFHAADEVLGVEELEIRAGADLVDHGGLQVQEHAPRHMLAGTRLPEEGVERVVSAPTVLSLESAHPTAPQPAHHHHHHPSIT